METATIIHDCLVKLLNNNDEDSFKCLCSLLTTMGKVLDLAEAKPLMDHCFNEIEKIVREEKTSSHIRGMLQDIIDLRLHNWGSTGPDQGPDNIDPSHKVAKIEEQEEPTQVQNQLLSKESETQPDPSEQRDQGVKRDEPWITVPKRKNSRATDPNKSPTLSKLINPGAPRPQPREIIVSLSVKEDVQMRTSENALKPGRNRESLPAEPKSQGTQDLLKKVCSILDKRTPRKFIQLMNKVKALTIDTEERLKGIVNLVFEKAIDEPSLSVAYGNMCCCLAELEVPITDEPNITVSFMKLLQGRCQKEFNKDKEDDVVIRAKQKELDSAPRMDRHRLLIELQEAKDIIRRRSIGYIKFVGELFKLKKLKAPVMHDCVVKMLKNQDNVSLECLCSLLTIIGKDLDLEEAKPRINHYFFWIKKIVREGKTATRIRVMLQDIIDLRLHNWGSTGPDQGPDNIDPSHKVAKIEEQEEPKQLLSKESETQPDPSEQRDQGVKRDEPWITVPKRKDSRATDPNKSPTLSKVKLINPGAPRPQPREIIVSLSVKEDVQMRTSENALKPGRNRESLPAEPKSQGTQDLLKKVRSILDKRTPRKFIQLMNKVKALTIDTEERLKGIVNLVFEKAIDEPSLSVAYGNMCCCLAELEVPITDEPNNTVSFMKLLQGRCQKEFNKDKEDDVVIRAKQKELDSAPRMDRHRLLIELQEAKDIIQRRSIGYIKFVGELFKLKKLKAPVMHDCMVKLLKNRDNLSLECLCSLLSIIGKDLDLEEAKPRINHYFFWIKKIVREGKTATRIRVMLQDIIDLRLHNWGSTGPDQGPDNIDPSHKVAKIEEQEEPSQVQNQLLSKESEAQPDPSEQRDQGVKRDEPWITVPKRKNSRATDPNKKPTLSKPQMEEKIQLGPQALVILVKAISGGAKASDSGAAVISSMSSQHLLLPK